MYSKAGRLMNRSQLSRRAFLGTVGVLARGAFLPQSLLLAQPGIEQPVVVPDIQPDGAADYTLTIATTPIEIASNRILSVTTYNGQFPGPLLRFKEGQKVVIDVHNETDT